MSYSRYTADVVRDGRTVLAGVAVDILDKAGAGTKAWSGIIHSGIPPVLFVNDICVIVYEGNRLDVMINSVSGLVVGFDALGAPY